MATLEITLLFLGSIIGAGFATGAEIVTFFGHLQLPVWWLATIVGVFLFIIISLEIFLVYPNFKTSNYQQANNNILKIQNSVKATKSAKNLDIVFVMIYQILFTAMTAGIIQIANIWACLISLILSIYIALFGFKLLSRFNSYIVALIIILIVSTAIPHLHPELHPQFDNNQIPASAFQAIIYAGLNCFMFPELITATAQDHTRKTLLHASAITALFVTILIYLILSIITATNTQNAPIPLLAAAPTPITTIVILLAILTSQYTALFAIMHRIQKLVPNTTKKPLTVAILICCLALIGSFCGFNQIIKFGYPLICAFTCFYLLISFLTKFLHLQQRHRS